MTEETCSMLTGIELCVGPTRQLPSPKLVCYFTLKSQPASKRAWERPLQSTLHLGATCSHGTTSTLKWLWLSHSRINTYAGYEFAFLPTVPPPARLPNACRMFDLSAWCPAQGTPIIVRKLGWCMHDHGVLWSPPDRIEQWLTKGSAKPPAPGCYPVRMKHCPPKRCLCAKPMVDIIARIHR